MKILFERSISDQDIANIKTPQELSDFLLVIEQAARSHTAIEDLSECVKVASSAARRAIELSPGKPRRGRPPKNASARSASTRHGRRGRKPKTQDQTTDDNPSSANEPEAAIATHAT